ncbi:uncharacterized protein LOC144625336 isoform X4 [Crassostrea virginica]
MARVFSCPKSNDEVLKASKRLKCGKDKYGHNQYMCLSNLDKTFLVEFCHNDVMGIEIEGNCLNVFQGKIYRESCARFQFGCPDKHYWKYEAYTYPACQYIDPVRKCYILDPSCVSRKPGNTADHDRKKNSENENAACIKDKHIDVLPSVLGAFFAIAIFVFIWLALYIWNKQDSPKGIASKSLETPEGDKKIEKSKTDTNEKTYIGIEVESPGRYQGHEKSEDNSIDFKEEKVIDIQRPEKPEVDRTNEENSISSNKVLLTRMEEF